MALAAQAPTSFEDLSSRAKAALDANDTAQAIELYKQAVALNPKWEEGWWYLGSLFYDADQYAAGRDALAHVIELDPKAAPAHALLGLCEYETGNYTDSLTHIRQGLASGAAEPQMEAVLRYHEALVLTRTGQFDKALAAYIPFARKGVQNPELLLGVGLAALRTPLVPKEIPEAQRDLYAMAGRAAYDSLAGNFAGAQQELAELMTKFPSAHYVHYFYGCFLLATKPEEGIEQLRRELEITPHSGAANATLAWILLERGQEDEARPYAENAARDEPQMSLAQYVFGRSLLEQGKIQSSIEHLELAKKSAPDDLETHISLTTAYSRSGQVAAARRERLETLQLWKEKNTGANR